MLVLAHSQGLPRGPRGHHSGRLAWMTTKWNDSANAGLLATVAQEIDIVDPYFDPRPEKGDYIGPLRSLLTELSSLAATPKVIRVHFGTHKSRPPSEILARDAPAQTKGLLPRGYCLELYEWSEVPGGESDVCGASRVR